MFATELGPYQSNTQTSKTNVRIRVVTNSKMAMSTDKDEPKSSPTTGSSEAEPFFSAYDRVAQLEELEKYTPDIRAHLEDFIDQVMDDDRVDADPESREALITQLLQHVDLELKDRDTNDQRLRALVEDIKGMFEDHMEKTDKNSEGKPYLRLRNIYALKLRQKKRKKESSSS